MDDEAIDAEKDAETVIAPTEVVQGEAVKTNTKEEKIAQEEKPEIILGIENKINELKKKKADIEEIIANYKKALSESTEERIAQRINSRIQDEEVKIDKVNEEIAKLNEENIRRNGVDLAYFNNLRDQIAEFEERGQNIRDNKDSKGKDLSKEGRKESVDLQDKEYKEYLKNKEKIKEIFAMAEKDSAATPAIEKAEKK